MEGDDLEDSMDETMVDKTTDTSQTQQSSGQPKIYHRWTVKGYWQDKHKHSLPDGWCEVFHTSGFPLYFHKQTRVVTLSRPYFLGSISVRHHLIPVASIPCLYMKRLQEEQEEPGESSPTNDESKCPFKTTEQENLTLSSNRKRKHSEDDVEEGEISSPHPSTGTNLEESPPSSSAQIVSELSSTRPTKPQQLPVSLQILTNSTLDDTLRFRTLTSDELRSYCQRRFAFEQREFKFFPSLGDKWKYIRQVQMKRREMNTPIDAQIIELQPLSSNDQSVVVSATLKTTDTPPQPSLKSSTITTSESTNLNNKKVTIDLYPSKSPIALLQEYALKRLKLSVRYDWFTTDVSNSPFGCRVLIGDTVYGTGIGRNKRTAKLNATEESLIILLPQYKKLQEQQQQQQQQTGNKETIIEEKSVEEEGCIDDDETSPIVNNNNNNNNDLNDQEQINSTLLDEYCISDANIYDVCVTLGKPTPYQMLEKSITYNALTRGESNIKLTMTKKPMFTHITLEIGSEHREEAQAKDKAHAKNLGITKFFFPHFFFLQNIFYFSCTKIIKKTSSTFTYLWIINSII
jgi:microprocessor complex subunit DGCR8